jgi:uncharacterized protein YbcI
MASQQVVSESLPDQDAGVAAEIADGIVDLIREHTGESPGRVEACIASGLVVITLANRLTETEEELRAAGHEELVLPARDLVLRGMRVEATAVIEGLTGREVVAYLTDNESDLAVMFFLLAPRPSERHLTLEADLA